MGKDDNIDLEELVAPTFMQTANSILGTLFLVVYQFEN
jgi:hypothetical protein